MIEGNMELNSLEFLVKIFFLITAAIAVITRVASEDRVAVRMGLDRSKMDSRHRYFGWVALFGFMSLLFWGEYSPVKASSILDRLLFLHIPLLLICTAAILFIAFKDEWERIIGDRFLKISWIIIFILGGLFTIDIIALLIRRFGLLSANLDFLYAIPYGTFVFVHAVIAFLIVIIRNLQVRGLGDSKNNQLRVGRKSAQAD